MKYSNDNVVWVCGNGVNAATRVLELNRRLHSQYFQQTKGMLDGVKVKGGKR